MAIPIFAACPIRISSMTGLEGLLGLEITSTRRAPGSVSCSISKSLSCTSSAMVETPVMLPPGRARLATSPTATGVIQAGADDWNGARQLLHGERRGIGGNDDGARMFGEQLGREFRKATGVAAGPADIEDIVAPFDQPGVAHAGIELRHLHLAGSSLRRAAADDGDDGRALLRAHSRRHDRSHAQERNEFPPLHIKFPDSAFWRTDR